ncbi:MAG TPA: hypothetical protein VIQ53_18020, partial [Inquilinus sp.]
MTTTVAEGHAHHMARNTEMAIPAAPVASSAGPVKKEPKPLPLPNSDFYQLVDVLTPDELAVVRKVR